ncbi:hypothetical protein GGI42DRAFT_214467 [Trichoderma sp. SZMC 28013]
MMRNFHLVAHPRSLSRPPTTPLWQPSPFPKEVGSGSRSHQPHRSEPPSVAELCLFRDQHTPQQQPVSLLSLQVYPGHRLRRASLNPSWALWLSSTHFAYFGALICHVDSLSGPASQPHLSQNCEVQVSSICGRALSSMISSFISPEMRWFPFSCQLGFTCLPYTRTSTGKRQMMEDATKPSAPAFKIPFRSRRCQISPVTDS